MVQDVGMKLDVITMVLPVIVTGSGAVNSSSRQPGPSSKPETTASICPSVVRRNVRDSFDASDPCDSNKSKHVAEIDVSGRSTFRICAP